MVREEGEASSDLWRGAGLTLEHRNRAQGVSIAVLSSRYLTFARGGRSCSAAGSARAAANCCLSPCRCTNYLFCINEVPCSLCQRVEHWSAHLQLELDENCCWTRRTCFTVDFPGENPDFCTKSRAKRRDNRSSHPKLCSYYYSTQLVLVWSIYYRN